MSKLRECPLCQKPCSDPSEDPGWVCCSDEACEMYGRWRVKVWNSFPRRSVVPQPHLSKRMREVISAAKRVADGWYGQNEIGEHWRDVVSDMNELQDALAALDKREGRP